MSIRLGTEPPFRPPSRGVLPERVFVLMGHPSADAYDRVLLEALSANICTLGRNNPLQRQSNGRMETPGFFYAGV